MARPRRVQRLQQLILEVAAETLQREIRDPRIGVVSVTRVRLTPDITQATLYWSTLAEGAALRTTARGLDDALPVVQRRVAAALRTRTAPRLVWRHDDTLEHAQRLDALFRRIRAETEPDALAADADGPSDEVPDGGGAEEE